MKSTLTIKDLSVTEELDRKALGAVHGGLANQANGTSQLNTQAMFAPVSVANGACFEGGPVEIQVDSYPTQSAHNTSTSTNSQGSGWEKMFPGFY
jgi:hypothetical protein